MLVDAESMKAPIQPMNLDQAEALYGQYFDQGEKFRMEHMSNYSYRFTARFINIGSKYKLFELLPLKSDKPADFCFLTVDKFRGVIIPDPFHEHRLKIKAASPPVPKMPPPLPNAAFQPKVNPHPDQGQREEPGSALPKEEGKAAAVDRWAI